MTKPNTREQIFDAALKLLSERSFNSCSVQDITAAAGVPKGSFYNHFESKEALAAEIVTHYGVLGKWREMLLDDAIAPLERLRRYFTIVNGKLAESGYQHGCMVGNMSAELAEQSPMIRAQLGEVYERWTDKLEYAVAAGQKEGSIPAKTDARILASFLLNAWEGTILRVRVERSSVPFEQFMDLAFNKILA
ncbi:TetR/AcrR family transcriptional regulator [Herbaspirillum robiniae]|uniref:Transcriptional regulator n=1 Tax=Herbaspirillum robiniae TaxID=2014887 RepID=A0A246WUQ4_9BURK|nr:TetR/AcrR family transcriptional regulator [Herbaspirillum robiniae]NUU00013.1 TetR family transcriptional regulator [Herbaspirillum robiniae]OWY30773.1 transcriptional regulator [Herbaspirillum robiniae]